jgi:hypothetical protein
MVSLTIGPEGHVIHLEALHEIATEKSVTITEALRRLVGYGIIVYRANRDNQDVLLRRDNKTERIVLVD